MSTSRITPRYASDEWAVGLGLALAIHAIPGVMIALTLAGYVRMRTSEHAHVAPPIIAAELLKLGDEARVFELPQRQAPAMPTTVPDAIVASENASNTPVEKHDAGVKPKETKEDDALARFADKGQLFAEKNAPVVAPVADAGVSPGGSAPGSAAGSTFGTQTDPSKVRGGSIYAAQLADCIRAYWKLPSFLSPGDVAHLNVKYAITFDQSMRVVAVSDQPTLSSGNDFFDDSARNALLTMRDQRVSCPQPPDAEAPRFRGKTFVFNLHP